MIVNLALEGNIVIWGLQSARSVTLVHILIHHQKLVNFVTPGFTVIPKDLHYARPVVQALIVLQWEQTLISFVSRVMGDFMVLYLDLPRLHVLALAMHLIMATV